MIVSIGPYDVTIPDAVSVKHFACDDYYGVIAVVDDHKYEVFCNKHMGPRLLISNAKSLGSLRDVPFHLGSAGLLPESFTTKLR